MKGDNILTVSVDRADMESRGSHCWLTDSVVGDAFDLAFVVASCRLDRFHAKDHSKGRRRDG